LAGIIPKVKKAAHIGIKKDKKTDNTITQEEFDKLKPNGFKQKNHREKGNHER